MMPFIEIYYEAGYPERGREEAEKMIKVCDDELTYYLALQPAFADTYYSTEMQQNLAVLQHLAEVTRRHGDEELSNKIEDILEGHMMVLQLPS